MSKITTTTPHGYQPGDIITMTVPDRRWWRRLMFWLLRRGTPMREQTMHVTAASETTITTQAKGACKHIYHAHQPLPDGQATAKCSKCGHEPRVLGDYQTYEIAPMAHDIKGQTT